MSEQQELAARARRIRALEAEVQELRAALVVAWDSGHVTPWKRGPDDCQCAAWNHGECACGEYGTGELLSLAQNPYREVAGDV